MWLPWRRPATPPPTALPEPAPRHWATLPPVQRALTAPPLVIDRQSFESSLQSWRSPAFLAPLGHLVTPDAPVGTADVARVQRRTDTRSVSFAPGRPTMPFDVEPPALAAAPPVPVPVQPLLTSAAATAAPVLVRQLPEAAAPELPRTSMSPSPVAVPPEVLADLQPETTPPEGEPSAAEVAPAVLSRSDLDSPARRVPVPADSAPRALPTAWRSKPGGIGLPVRADVTPDAPVVARSTERPVARATRAALAQEQGEPLPAVPPEPTGDLLGDPAAVRATAGADAHARAVDLPEGRRSAPPEPELRLPVPETLGGPSPVRPLQRSTVQGDATAPQPSAPTALGASSPGDAPPGTGAPQPLGVAQRMLDSRTERSEGGRASASSDVEVASLLPGPSPSLVPPSGPAVPTLEAGRDSLGRSSLQRRPTGEADAPPMASVVLSAPVLRQAVTVPLITWSPGAAATRRGVQSRTEDSHGSSFRSVGATQERTSATDPAVGHVQRLAPSAAATLDGAPSRTGDPTAVNVLRMARPVAPPPAAPEVTSWSSAPEPVEVPADGHQPADSPGAWTTELVVSRSQDVPVSTSAAPTTSTPAATPAPANAGPDLDDLARKLYDRLRSRLAAELRLDRERIGSITDLPR
jgi:hypothetical protein